MSSKAELEQKIMELQARYDTLLMAFERVAGKQGEKVEQHVPFGGDVGVWRALSSMTGKQHATLQMVLGAKPNAEIARRLGISEATAKTHVRSVCLKIGVRTRQELMMRASPVIERMSDADYRRMSGLPKDWDASWKRPDPYSGVYGGG